DAADRPAETAAPIVNAVHHHLGDGHLTGAGLIARFVQDDLGEAGQLGIDDLRASRNRRVGVGRGDQVAKAPVADLVRFLGRTRLLDDERLGGAGGGRSGKRGDRYGGAGSLGKLVRFSRTGGERETQG